MLYGLDKYYNMFSNYKACLNDFKTNLIFAGIKGTGKFSFAKEMAFKTNKHENNIHIIQPEENKKSVSIEQIRQLFQDINNKPYEDEKHIIVIDDVDGLNNICLNALLKRLEEPQPTELFILIVHDSSNLLDTIKSRCIIIDFIPDYSSVPFKIENERDAVIYSVLKEQGISQVIKYKNDIKTKSMYLEAYSVCLEFIQTAVTAGKIVKNIKELIDKLTTCYNVFLLILKYYMLSSGKYRELYLDLLVNDIIKSNNNTVNLIILFNKLRGNSI